MLDTLKLQQMQCLGKHDDGGDGGFNCDGNGDGDDHDDPMTVTISYRMFWLQFSILPPF